MITCLSDEQRKYVDLSRELGKGFAARAAEHDRDNTFPHRNYDDLREAGFLGLPAPVELGGLGAGLAEILPVLETLAMGDGSTALAFAMHIVPVAQWSSIWRRTKNRRIEEKLREAVRGEMIWCSVTSEVGATNDLTDARTRAVKVPGGYLLTGRKSFGTNTAVATHCSTTARDDHADGGPRVIFCQVPLDQPGVTVHEVWNTMGMRGTQSNDLEFADVFVPDEAVGHSLPVGHLDARVLKTTWAWAMPAFAAIYTGIAAGALQWVTERTVDGGRGMDPLAHHLIGECQIMLEGSRALIHRHVDEVASGRLFDIGVQEGVSRCAVVKYTAANNAVAVMQRLVEAVGGASYAKAMPFERMWRDVQAATFMPMNNVVAQKLVGASTLGVQLAPTIDFHETGHASRAKPH